MLRRATRPPWAPKPSAANTAGSRRPVVGAARAKVAYLEVEKTDKAGRKYAARDEITISDGMFSAREAQRDIDRAVEHSEYPVLDAVVETYGPGEAPPMTASPRRADGSGNVFAGFQGAAWLPESPLIQRINARREDSSE